jgi:DNA-binding HxlR family transcriptional regulator
MNIETDEYCEKIFMVLIIINKKTRFNELHRQLTKYHAKMSKPTLIEHLIKHLVKNEIIQQNVEDTQKVTYEINWKRFKQLQKEINQQVEINQTALNRIKNEKEFKSRSLEDQTIFVTAMTTIGELSYLKLQIRNILEPENELQNYFSYTIIRKLYNIYATWLYDSCKKSKENSQKTINLIDKKIKMLRETCFK